MYRFHHSVSQLHAYCIFRESLDEEDVHGKVLCRAGDILAVLITTGGTGKITAKLRQVSVEIGDVPPPTVLVSHVVPETRLKIYKLVTNLVVWRCRHSGRRSYHNSVQM